MRCSTILTRKRGEASRTEKNEFGFICVWNIPNTVFTCLHLRYASSWCRDGHEGFFTFLRAFYTFLFVPLLVLFLHWLFGWCPVQLWVWIVLGVYTLATLAGSISYGRHV